MRGGQGGPFPLTPCAGCVVRPGEGGYLLDITAICNVCKVNQSDCHPQVTVIGFTGGFGRAWVMDNGDGAVSVG